MSLSSIFSSFWSMITGLCMLISTVLGVGTTSTSPKTTLVDTDKLYLEQALIAGQGITTDGEYYYTSGSMTALNATGLAKWNADDFSPVTSRTGVIPDECVEKYSSNHVGGISYYGGLVYAAVENKGKDHPLVITYDCDTLTAVDVYEMPGDILPNGIPWCAVDAQNGYLYCSPFRNVTKIIAFDLETMSFSHYIELSEEITSVQGGEVYENALYLSCDNGDNTDTVYSIDVFSGETHVLFERTLPGLAGNEAEGMTVYPMADGSLYHIIDYDKTVSISIRHYAPV